MAVVIRMKRTGRRNRPCYRISVSDRNVPRDGRTLENLGVYDPASPKPDLRLTLDVERARHWLSVGALPSETVNSIFEREGVYEGDRHKAPRRRTGRKKPTKKREARIERKKNSSERKEARRTERKAVRAAAKKAAAAAEGSEES